MHAYIENTRSSMNHAQQLAGRLRRLNNELGGNNDLSAKEVASAPEAVRSLLDELGSDQGKLSDQLFAISDQIDRLENLLGMAQPKAEATAGRY